MGKKKLLLIIIVLFIFSCKVEAQFSDRFGVNLILSASKQNIQGNPHFIDEYENYKYEASCSYSNGFGIFYDIYKTNHFDISINFEYITRGTEVYYPIYLNFGYGPLAKTFNKINYLSAPIIGKIKLNHSNYNYHLLLGLRGDLKISYRSDYLEEYYKEASDFQFGVILGFECEMKISDYLTILPGLKYNVDLSNSIEKYGLKFKNKSIDFSMGIRILKKLIVF